MNVKHRALRRYTDYIFNLTGDLESPGKTARLNVSQKEFTLPSLDRGPTHHTAWLPFLASCRWPTPFKLWSEAGWGQNLCFPRFRPIRPGQGKKYTSPLPTPLPGTTHTPQTQAKVFHAIRNESRLSRFCNRIFIFFLSLKLILH